MPFVIFKQMTEGIFIFLRYINDAPSYPGTPFKKYAELNGIEQAGSENGSIKAEKRDESDKSIFNTGFTDNPDT